MRWLGTERLSFRDLWIIVRHAPRDSSLSRQKEPVESQWADSEYLLASMVDSLNWLVWAKSKDGSKNRNMPEPIPRPGQDSKNKKLTGTVLPMDQMARAFDLPDPRFAA